MKRIFFIRHAKSSWNHPGLSDHDRPLNKRGKADAPFMGKLLAENDLIPQKLISSTAKRAFSTAEKFAAAFQYPAERIIKERELYHSGISTILSVVQQQPDDLSSIMIFIHNPGITEVVNHCCRADIFNIPTCGVAGIEFDTNTWSAISNNGKLFLYEYPKKYYNESGEGPLLQP